jgi:hypothetical protein
MTTSTLVGEPPGHQWLAQLLGCATQGWHMDKVLESGRANGIPKNDLYGALYHHVRGVVRRFCQKLSVLQVSFEMCQCDAGYLNQLMASHGRHFYQYRFDCIDLSNITDSMYKGTKIVSSFAPFLKPMTENPHATILCLYMKTLEEYFSSVPTQRSKAANKKRTEDVLRLMPLTPRDPVNPLHRAHFSNLAVVATWFMDTEALYKCFYDDVLLPTGKRCGLAVKENSTIMKRWPFSLQGGKDLDAEKAELKSMLASGVKGYALYIEWKLTREVELPKFKTNMVARQYYMD